MYKTTYSTLRLYHAPSPRVDREHGCYIIQHRRFVTLNLRIDQLKSRYVLLGLVMLVLVAGMLSAWRWSNSTQAAPPPNTSTSIPAQASFTPTAVITNSTKIILASSTPLDTSTSTPAATDTLSLPLETDTPIPTPTIKLGWINGWVPKNSRDVIISNAWRSIVGSQLVTLDAGRSAAADMFDPSNSEGLLYVSYCSARVQHSDHN
jgi:hypothetical protein